MKNIKGIFLFILLLFPVLIYFFLQGFGENQFDVPAFFQEGDTLRVTDCQREMKLPFIADLSVVFSATNELIGQEFIVFAVNYEPKQVRNNIASFIQKYQNVDKVKLVILNAQDSLTPLDSKVLPIVLPLKQLYAFVKCQLQIPFFYGNGLASPFPSQLVLLDSSGRIRGYYDSTQLKEIDRLNTELLILINNINIKYYL